MGWDARFSLLLGGWDGEVVGEKWWWWLCLILGEGLGMGVLGVAEGLVLRGERGMKTFLMGEGEMGLEERLFVVTVGLGRIS